MEEEEYMGRPRNASGINTADLCCDQNRLEENNFGTFLKASYVKVAKDLKHLCFFLKKLISRQREAPESASFNLIPITHNIKGLDVQICRRGSPGGEI